MAKRRLSKQQIRNIEQNKQHNEQSLDDADTGLVISHFGKQLEVESQNGETFFCQYRQNLGQIVAGDKVLWQTQENAEHGIILKRLARKNALIRPSQLNKKEKVMAANIDQLIIMIALQPPPIEHYIDRYIVAGHHMDISPVIVINKMDLYDQSSNQSQIDTLRKLYQGLGYPVINICASTKENLAQLKKQLSHKTSIFVGQSGVGKSQTLNTLFNQSMTLTGGISQQNQRGKHTTTTARLFHFDQHTNIIDSPGIREFGIWHLSSDDILAGFSEMKDLQGQCKFRNCQHHQNSKGCAIYQAYQSGSISKQRLNNYHRLIYELHNGKAL